MKRFLMGVSAGLLSLGLLAPTTGAAGPPHKPGMHKPGMHKPGKPGFHKGGFHKGGFHKGPKFLTKAVKFKGLAYGHQHKFSHHRIHPRFRCRMYWHPYRHCWFYWHPVYRYYLPVQYIYVYPPEDIEVEAEEEEFEPPE